MNEKRTYRFYTLVLAGLLSSALMFVYAVNVLVDPLWHFSGSKIINTSFRFDERNMKVNYFNDNPENYNCMIFGASRTVLLDESLLEEHNCFNMAFVLGHVREFVMVAECVKQRGFTPDRVIVGVDEVSFEDRAYTDGENLPAYVLTHERPKWSIEDYLGKTAFSFSIDTIRRTAPKFIIYRRRDDRTFKGTLQWHGKTYDPDQHEVLTQRFFQPFDREMFHEFVKLREVFPDTEFVGYVPPVSDWRSARMELTGNLESYIDLRYRLSALFDGGFWDFSVPNETTADKSLTQDGAHYIEPVNVEIANCLNGQIDFCGVDVHALSFEQYRNLIVTPVRERISRENLSATLADEG